MTEPQEPKPVMTRESFEDWAEKTKGMSLVVNGMPMKATYVNIGQRRLSMTFDQRLFDAMVSGVEKQEQPSEDNE